MHPISRPAGETFTGPDGCIFTDDRKRLDLAFVLDFLKTTYWAKDENPSDLQTAIERSSPYGLYRSNGTQIGFVRVLSDGVFNARISDLFVVPEARGEGLGKWMMEILLHQSRFCRVRNWQLATDDAHGLYETFGFQRFQNDGSFMMLRRP